MHLCMHLCMHACAGAQTHAEWVLLCTHPGQLLWVPGTPPASIRMRLRGLLLKLNESEALLGWKKAVDPQEGEKALDGQELDIVSSCPSPSPLP